MGHMHGAPLLPEKGISGIFREFLWTSLKTKICYQRCTKFPQSDMPLVFADNQLPRALLMNYVTETK